MTVQVETATVKATDVELFKQVMQATAEQLGLNMEYLHEGWKVVFSDNYQQERYELLNYDIGLNSCQASFKAKDKTMCFNYLHQAGVPTIEHFLLPPKTYKYADTDAKTALAYVKNNYCYPLVVKQNNGGGGKHIHFAFDELDLTLAIAELAKQKVEIALSPYYDFNIEYRCTVLDNKVEMAYGKTKGDNLQNNLSKGAQVVDVPESIQEELYALAVNASQALGLRFANIDIVETKKGLKVLEVNNTVALKRVTRDSADKMRQAVNVYVKAIKLLRGERE